MERPRGWPRTSRAAREAGILTLLCLAFGAAAALAHHLSSLPADYTWTRPIDILWNVVRRPYFPSIALGALLLGMAAREGASLARLRALVAAGQTRGRLRLAGAAAAAAAGAFLSAATVQEYRAVDHLAVAAIVWVALANRPTVQQAARAAAHLAYVALFFVVVSYTFTVFKALLFARGAPADALVLDFERFVLGFEPHRAIAEWSARHPDWVRFSDAIYYRLFDHMAVASIFLIGLRKARERTEMLAALAVAYLLGGLSYHLLPAVGPALHDPAAFRFLDENGLISNALRPRLLRNTLAVAGGTGRVLETYEYLAAVPSLHMAHEFIMLYYARHSRPFFLLTAAFTGLTGFAVMVLGWHYPTDIVAGLALAVPAVALARACRGVLLPAALVEPPPLDEPLVVDSTPSNA